MWGYSIEQYLEKLTAKVRKKTEKHIQKLKDKGKGYYTPDRLRLINAVKAKV